LQENWALGGKTARQENKKVSSMLNIDDDNSVLYEDHSEDEVSSPGQNE